MHFVLRILGGSAAYPKSRGTRFSEFHSFLWLFGNRVFSTLAFREKRMRDVITSAGFRRFRRATETPFNIVYEANEEKIMGLSSAS